MKWQERAREQAAVFLLYGVCGFTARTDENAAVNILRAGLALRLQRQAAERVAEELAA